MLSRSTLMLSLYRSFCKQYVDTTTGNVSVVQNSSFWQGKFFSSLEVAVRGSHSRKRLCSPELFCLASKFSQFVRSCRNMKHMLALGVIFTVSVANALYLADCDQGVNCDCPADRKGQLKMYRGKIFVCTGSRWSLYGDYGDESHPGSSCKDIKDRKGEESANGTYWIKLKGQDEAFPVYCDMDNGGWTMVFKAVTRKENVYELYTSGNTSSEDVKRALDVTKKYPHHYKNRIVLNWEGFKPSEARVALYTKGELQKELKFNATGSNNSNWFTCSALTQSSWFDIPTEHQNYFSIYGSVHEAKDKRHFFINRIYRDCPNDEGWMVITEREHCPWETNKKNAILYSKLPVYTNWNTHKNVLEADVLVVYVR